MDDGDCDDHEDPFHLGPCCAWDIFVEIADVCLVKFFFGGFLEGLTMDSSFYLHHLSCAPKIHLP